mmetsp:Transcript_27229/g.68730  ORF Transcript_27229/g.68730 Transcript_27229/m.68730 type:complete len:480 (+) Transcript_27229:76-1515(+)
MPPSVTAPLLAERDAPAPARGSKRDVALSFVGKGVRMFSYGAIAPIFFSFLKGGGLSEQRIGVLLTAILLGDLVITLWLTTRADGLGRRKVLMVSALLKIFSGVVFATTSKFYLLVLAGVIGVISPSGGDIGPFLAVEQACLTEALTQDDEKEAKDSKAEIAVVFGWYNGLGCLTQALGALASGLAVRAFVSLLDWSLHRAHQAVFVGYGIIGVILVIIYASLSDAVEPQVSNGYEKFGEEDVPTSFCGRAAGALLPKLHVGLRRPESKFIVARLSALFALDALGGGFVMTAWIAYWFSERWGLSPELLGSLLMAASLVAGISGIAASHLVKSIGAMLTMVVTHLPSNILLGLVPLMPTAATASAMLVARYCISQMDVPARQAYVAMSVASDERSAAGGLTNIVRSLGTSFSPLIVGILSSRPPSSFAFSSPWLIAAGLKIIYDITLYSLYRCGTELRAHEASAARKDEQERRAPNVKA